MLAQVATAHRRRNGRLQRSPLMWAKQAPDLDSTPHYGVVFALARDGQLAAEPGLAAIASDPSQAAIVRATALSLMAGYQRQNSAAALVQRLEFGVCVATYWSHSRGRSLVFCRTLAALATLACRRGIGGAHGSDPGAYGWLKPVTQDSAKTYCVALLMSTWQPRRCIWIDPARAPIWQACTCKWVK